MSLRPLPYGPRSWFVYAAFLMIGLAAPAHAKDIHILAFGDSLTAGYGLKQGQGFAPQLEDALRRHGISAFVVNAGVSGDTTAGGRSRIGWTLDGLKQKPDLAIIALGGNDMLRGIAPGQTRADLDFILAELKRRNIRTLVAGMMAAPNLGPAYGTAFNRIFPDLAKKYGAPLYPFFLDGVTGNAGLNLPDRIHPNFQGIKQMVTRILPYILETLGKRS
ncbi:arylesterase [Sphingosinicella rhizophila]|uniref:Arylesterase n=1 Tax=Sphingosinicella rhizophila TaxID=3050082 RepID=A0ABU3Q8P5_9SPHN|nr:arylesterase [Sphingosinicella sp. GR2756]MDT9599353.1 arylesterase [Sphingosinicella sp. GR2756]